MDAVSYSHSAKQAQRIKKFIAEPDVTSGLVTVPSVVASGETVSIPAGRTLVHPNLRVDGTLQVDGTLFIPSGGTIEDNTLSVNALTVTGTGYMRAPVGTTAQRPASPANGYLRYNTDLASVEVYGNGAWGSIGGGGGGTGNGFTYMEPSDPLTTTNGAVGDLWFNTTTLELFICRDATVDANVWEGNNGTNIHVQTFPSLGLLASYELDIDATDSTGNYNGTSNNVTFDGSSAFFSKSASYITMPNINTVNSISFWLKTTDYGNSMCMGTTDNTDYMFYLNNPSIYFKKSTEKAVSVGNLSFFDDGKFHFLCVTFDGVLSKLYVNNDTPISFNSGADVSFKFSTIGGGAPNYYLIAGRMAKIHVYNRPLSTSEVSGIYNAEKGFFL